MLTSWRYYTTEFTQGENRENEFIDKQVIDDIIRGKGRKMTPDEKKLILRIRAGLTTVDDAMKVRRIIQRRDELLGKPDEPAWNFPERKGLVSWCRRN